MFSFVNLAAPNISIEYEGKTYYFTAQTFKDWSAYIIWWQFRDLRIAEEQTLNFPPDERKKILKEVFDKCVAKTWNDGTKDLPLSPDAPEIQESMNTFEGIAYQCYLSLKHKHPEITEELTDKIVSLVTYEAVLGKLLLVQGLVKEKIETGEAQTPVNKIKKQLTGVAFIDNLFNWGKDMLIGKN